MKNFILTVEHDGSVANFPTGTSLLQTATKKANTLFDALYQMDRDKKLIVKVIDSDGVTVITLGKKKIDEDLRNLRDISASIFETASTVKAACGLMALQNVFDKGNNLNLLLKNTEILGNQIEKFNVKLNERLEK